MSSCCLLLEADYVTGGSNRYCHYNVQLPDYVEGVDLPAVQVFKAAMEISRYGDHSGGVS